MNETTQSTLELMLKHAKTILVVLAFALLILFGAAKIRGLQKQVVAGQNQVALLGKTVEAKDGLYTRQVQQTANVASLLDGSNKQVQELEQTLKQRGEQLDNATTVGLHWKQAYEGAVAAQQSDGGVTTEPDGGTVARLRVDFSIDYDPGDVGVSGYTLTDPPESHLKIWQLRPLKLTLALSQDKQGAWHQYVTTSEPGLTADVQVSAVNPSIRDVRWYERIGAEANVGIGSGLLVGAGLTLDVGKVSVGPAVWLTVNPAPSVFYGATAIYRPFAR